MTQVSTRSGEFQVDAARKTHRRATGSWTSDRVLLESPARVAGLPNSAPGRRDLDMHAGRGAVTKALKSHSPEWEMGLWDLKERHPNIAAGCINNRAAQAAPGSGVSSPAALCHSTIETDTALVGVNKFSAPNSAELMLCSTPKVDLQLAL